MLGRSFRTVVFCLALVAMVFSSAHVSLVSVGLMLIHVTTGSPYSALSVCVYLAVSFVANPLLFEGISPGQISTVSEVQSVR